MLELAFATALGIILGIVSGLTPGIHTNTFALILASITPFLLKLGFSPESITLIIVTNAITHTFLDIIPSVFLGAPEADSALAILPMHEMLLTGKGIEAIKLSAFGSLVSSILSLGTIPFVFILITNISDYLERYTGYILLLIAFMVIFTEKGEYVYGAGRYVRLKYIFLAGIVFILSGILGYFSFEFSHLSTSVLPFPPNVLFPLLTGLFGAPMLLLSYFHSPEIPEQKDRPIEIPFNIISRGFITGTFSGFLVSLFPGVSNGVATVISRLTTPYGKFSGKEFITSISGANTSNAIFSLLALYALGKTRSGACVYIREILFPVTKDLFLLWSLSIGVSSLIACALTIYIGKGIARKLNYINYSGISISIFIFLTILITAFNGLLGLIIFTCGILIGIIPAITGVRRVNCMGVLLLPLIFAKI